jgi:hypothetical protein
MLIIKDLAAAKDLDRCAMLAITGGSSVFSNSALNANMQVGGVSFASAQGNFAPVTQADASQHTNVDTLTVDKSITSIGSLLGGIKL